MSEEGVTSRTTDPFGGLSSTTDGRPEEPEPDAGRGENGGESAGQGGGESAGAGRGESYAAGGGEIPGGADGVTGGGFPAHDHGARRDRVRELLVEAEATALLVTDPVNVRYLSGFSGTNGQVLVGPSPGDDQLITDGRYEARAATEAPDLPAVLSRDPTEVALELVAQLAGGGGGAARVRGTRGPGTRGPGTRGPGPRGPATRRPGTQGAGGRDGGPSAEGSGGSSGDGGPGGSTGDGPGGSSADGPERGGGPSLAAEAEHLTWSEGRQLAEQAEELGVAVRPTTGLVRRCRVVKDDAELARIAHACVITEEALAWLFAEVVAPGRTERELATALERRFVDLGADGRAFPSIVASGPNAAIPHHARSGRPLAAGDLLTVDCGALVEGYHADHTRTVAIGHLDDGLRGVHALVVEAQAAGRAAVLAGATSGDVDAAARAVIDAAGYRERFVHGTGHGVGLEIHEAPAVAEGAAARLVPGTALTVEPGVYLPGLGGVRIEDTLVVTADGPARPLTDTPRELLVL